MKTNAPRTIHAFRAVALAGVAALALSGCTETKRALGFEKSVPDEFQVVERAPLSMPPDFSLRPPTPGAVRPQEGTTTDQAKAAMLGRRGLSQTAQLTAAGRSPGDMALLKKAGADQALADIRGVVNKETLSLAEADKSFTDKLVFWRKPQPYGEVVDATKEAQRLRENQALGKAVTEGETPKIERRKRAMLENLF